MMNAARPLKVFARMPRSRNDPTQKYARPTG
jgi:hypothetical protein